MEVSNIYNNKVDINDQSYEINTIIFCTGHRANLSFINDAVLEELEYNNNDTIVPLILYNGTVNNNVSGIGFVCLYRPIQFLLLSIFWIN